MNIIKEYCPSANICVIRTNTYGKTLEFINNLALIAAQDFPGLKTKDIEIVRYAGQRYAKTFGIEFQPIGEIPNDYAEIYELEFTT